MVVQAQARQHFVTQQVLQGWQQQWGGWQGLLGRWHDVYAFQCDIAILRRSAEGQPAQGLRRLEFACEICVSRRHKARLSLIVDC